MCVWYSASMKRIPFLDVPVHDALGSPRCRLVASLGTTTSAGALAAELGLFSGVFESIQGHARRGRLRMRRKGSARPAWCSGPGTNPDPCAGLDGRVQRGFAAAALHPIAGGLSAIALVVPFSADHVVRYWTQVKLVYGVEAWLFVCAWVFLRATALASFGRSRNRAPLEPQGLVVRRPRESA